MKKILLASTCLLLVATSALAAPGDPKTGVVSSVHDMRNYGGSPNDDMNRVCAYCHTPHHAATTGNDYLPLWSHEISQEALQPYWSVTLQSQSVAGDFLMGPSKLCMSCHDGSIAVDQHYGNVGAIKLSGDDYLQPNVGDYNATTLTNDHPIGFDYVAVANSSGDDVAGPMDLAGGKDGYINKATDTLVYKGNTSTIKVKDRLWADVYMTCATCHDVHNRMNADVLGDQNYLVLGAQSGSQLCLTCHIK